MKLNIILLKDTPKVGQKGDIKSVSLGYFKNFLAPQGLAKTLNKDQMGRAKEEIALKQNKQKELQVKMEELAKKIDGLTLSFSEKADKTGKLFGSVGIKEIIKELRKNKMDIQEKSIDMPEPIKNIGEFDIPVVFDDKLKSTLKIIIKKAK